MKTFLTVLILPMIASLMTSCGDYLDADNYPYYAFVQAEDKSQSSTVFYDSINTKALTTTLLDLMNFDEEGVQLQFYTTEIGLPVPTWKPASIPGRNMNIFSIFEREEEQASFVSDFEYKVDALINSPAEYKVSNIYRGLCYSISLMDTLADKRTVLIRSDFQEDSPIMSFRKTKLTPDNYDSIKEAFISAHPLPAGLNSTLHVIMVISNQDEKSIQSMKFFEWLLKESGVRVTIKPSLI